MLIVGYSPPCFSEVTSMLSDLRTATYCVLDPPFCVRIVLHGKTLTTHTESYGNQQKQVEMELALLSSVTSPDCCSSGVASKVSTGKDVLKSQRGRIAEVVDAFVFVLTI